MTREEARRIIADHLHDFFYPRLDEAWATIDVACCKDCEHGKCYVFGDVRQYICTKFAKPVKAEDYCSWGRSE